MRSTAGMMHGAQVQQIAVEIVHELGQFEQLFRRRLLRFYRSIAWYRSLLEIWDNNGFERGLAHYQVRALLADHHGRRIKVG